MDLASHFKEFSKKKGEINYALDILVFIRVKFQSYFNASIIDKKKESTYKITDKQRRHA